jgi:F-type H+-transporting ATPase subunit a
MTIYKRIIFVFVFIFSFGLLRAEHEDHGQHEEKGFDPGKVLIEHVADNHEWHVFSYHGEHYSIPLPVILWGENGLEIFSSSHFAHGHSYNGYKIEGGLVVREDGGESPLDFSITKNVAQMFISILLMLWLFLSVAKAYKKRKNQAPKGIQSVIEPVIVFIRDDVARGSIDEKHVDKFLPYLLTLFFFILFNNILGLIPVFPGGANVTGNLAVTGVMAIFTFFMTSFHANKNYWVHIINTPGVPWWLKIPVPLMPLVEIIGMFTKPFSLMIRLFANITAGHLIILGFVSLILLFGVESPGVGFGVAIPSTLFMVFMGLLEFLVAFIQAFIFTLLSAVYLGMATEEHH